MKLKTGDIVVYASDVHREHTGRMATALEFDLKDRLVHLEFPDGAHIWAFWDEITETPGAATPRESK